MKIPKNRQKLFESTLIERGLLDSQQLEEFYQSPGEQTLVQKLISDGTLTEKQLKDILKKVRNELYKGQTIGKYEIQYKIGKGSMGTVFKVRHQDLKKQFALKMIVASEFTNKEALLRFHREARTIAKLHHPNIIQIFDSGQEKYNHYYIMEYIKGAKTLDSLIQEGIEIRNALSLLQKILKALHYAHEQGIIHRDLKPENILITTEGEPKIGDFGLAKDYTLEAQAESNQQKITFAGQILGTPSYMSPEQASGETELGPQSDIYSIGACLYHLLTSKCPHEAPTLHLLLYKIITEPILNPSMIKKEISRDVETIVLKALSKAPEERYPSALEFAEDIERYLTGFPIHARQISRPEKVLKWTQRNPHYFLAFLLLGFSFFGLFGYMQWSRYQEKQKRFTEALQKANGARLKAKIEQNRKIQYLLQELSYLNIALSLQPDHLLTEQKKIELGQSIIHLATANEAYHVANYVAREMDRLKSLSEEKKQSLFRSIENSKKKKEKQHQAQLEEWISLLKSKKQDQNTREEVVIEISEMKEEIIFNRLLTILAEGTEYFLTTSFPSEIQQQFYETMILALGRLGNSSAGPMLYDSLKKLTAKVSGLPIAKRPPETLHVMVALANALAYSKVKHYTDKLNDLRFNLGQEGLFWFGSQSAYLKLAKRDKVTQLKTNNKTINFNKRGYALMQQGHLKEALENFNKAIRRNPRDPYIFSNRGVANEKLKRFSAAIEDHTKAIQLNPRAPSFYYNRGGVRLKLYDLEGAYQDFSLAIQINPNYAIAYTTRGRVRELKGDEKGALKDFTKAIQLNPNIAVAYNDRAALLVNQKQFTKALQDYNKAIQLNPHQAEFFHNRGRAYLKNNQPDLALKDSNESIRLAPNFSRAYLSRGDIKEELQDFDGALQDYTEALRLNPKELKAYIRKIEIKTMRNDLEGVQQEIDAMIQFLDKYPNSDQAAKLRILLPELKSLVKNLNQNTAPLEDLKKELEYFLKIGQQKEAKGDIDGAIRDYMAILTYEPEHPILEKVLALLIQRCLKNYRKKNYQTAESDLLLYLKYAPEKHPDRPRIEKLLKKIQSKLKK